MYTSYNIASDSNIPAADKCVEWSLAVGCHHLGTDIDNLTVVDSARSVWLAAAAIEYWVVVEIVVALGYAMASV